MWEHGFGHIACTSRKRLAFIFVRPFHVELDLLPSTSLYTSAAPSAVDAFTALPTRSVTGSYKNNSISQMLQDPTVYHHLQLFQQFVVLASAKERLMPNNITVHIKVIIENCTPIIEEVTVYPAVYSPRQY